MALTDYTDFSTSQPRTLFAWGPTSSLAGDPPSAGDSFLDKLGSFIRTGTQSALDIMQARNAQNAPVQTGAIVGPGVSDETQRMIKIGFVALIVLIIILIVRK